MNFIIADDSDFYRNLFRKHLSNLGHTVLADAKNGSELIKKVKQYKPEFVLTDVGMEPINGMDASTEILKSLPDTKIICITSYNISAWIHQMQIIGIRGYVYKHTDLHTLEKAIESAVVNVFYTDKSILKHLLNEIKDLNDLNDLNEEINKIISSTQKLKDVNGFIPNERELLILSATAAGKPIKQIAELLKTSERNIGKIKVKMRDKCGVETTPELIGVAHKNKWVA